MLGLAAQQLLFTPVIRAAILPLLYLRVLQPLLAAKALIFRAALPALTLAAAPAAAKPATLMAVAAERAATAATAVTLDAVPTVLAPAATAYPEVVLGPAAAAAAVIST